MPERVGRVAHGGEAADPVAPAASAEEVAHEVLGRDELVVGEHMPGADGEPAGADQGG